MTRAQDDAGNRYIIQSVDRAIRILSAFSVQQPGLTLGQIADLIGISKGGAFRLLATLEHHGLVVKDSSASTYSLGFGVLELAGVRLRQTDVREVALPHMRKLRDDTDETVVLCLRVGDYRVHVEQLESYRPFHRTGRVGEHVPLYAGAASKVLLTAMGEEEVHNYLDRVELERLASNTVIDPDALLQELSEIRAKGYAAGYQERAEDTAGLAAPVYGADDVIVAALQIPLLLQHFTPEACDELIPAMMDTANAISRDLGAGRFAGTVSESADLGA